MIVITGLFILNCCTYNKMKMIKIDCHTPDSAKFSAHVLPVLILNCANQNCHSGNSPSGKLNLEAAVAYKSLTDKKAGYIDTLNPKYSVLYSSMVSSSNPMPPSGKLDDCSLEIIEKWMQQKAKNN